LAMLVGLRVPAIKRNFGKIGVLVILAACLFSVLESSFGIIELIVTALGRNMTFTDRVPLWNTLVAFGMENPYWGYGYEGFWIGSRHQIEGLSQAHNGYLEIFVEGGLVAIILLGVLLLSVFRNIQKNGLRDYEPAAFRLCFFAMILLANLTESAFARERDLLTFVFYIIAMDYAPSRKYSNADAKLESYDEGEHYGLGHNSS
jgi:exopolysaccharide production protein ExoQ